MGFLELISFVSAHTGNDTYNHGMEFFDWVFFVLLLVSLILLIRGIIKRRKDRKS